MSYGRADHILDVEEDIAYFEHAQGHVVMGGSSSKDVLTRKRRVPPMRQALAPFRRAMCRRRRKKMMKPLHKLKTRRVTSDRDRFPLPAWLKKLSGRRAGREPVEDRRKEAGRRKY
ncbi:uncharacterized protein LOC144055310 [Vanacampus margaritifer]